MQDVVTQRFISCHNYLIEQNKVRSSRQFALSLDYLPQSLSEILKGRRNVTIEVVRKAIETYDMNPSYLFCGSGAMFKSEEGEPASDVLVVMADENNNERIIHVPFPAQAGYGGQLYDPSYIKELPSFTLPDQYFQTGTFRSFDISGDSMEPTLFENERVVCSYVEKESWKHDIRDNYVYVVITKCDVVVKRVENRIKEEGAILLISDNDYYQPRVLPADEILEMWLVKLKISPFMPSPKNIRNALHKEIDSLRETLKGQNAMIGSLNQTIEKLLKQNRARV